jgi:hypothetical protein
MLHDELDEVNEAIFFEKGMVDVGFAINRKQNFVIRLSEDIQIGSYNITFDKRSKYIFKTSQVCIGFSIRRINWKIVMMDEDFDIITTPLKKKIMIEYEEVTAQRVTKEKATLMAKWAQRNDYDAMLRVVDNEVVAVDLDFSPQVDNLSQTYADESSLNQEDTIVEMIDEYTF